MSLEFVFAGVVNGLMAGGIYVLVATGLTLIYGVLHIINFAHGSLLMLAMYAVYYLFRAPLGVDPYLALPLVTGGAFLFGYLLYRGVIGRFSHGRDENILLITLGLSIIADNAALFFFTGDTQTIDVPYAGRFITLGPALVALPKLISFGASMLMCVLLAIFMSSTDMGKAIRAVAKERQGARLVGIDVENVFAVSYGIGIACLGAAACLLMPFFYVSPSSGHVFVLIAFTTVVLGGMGSFGGALIGGLIIGVVESLGGLQFGEQLGQLGVPLVFILILLIQPAGLFGKALMSRTTALMCGGGLLAAVLYPLLFGGPAPALMRSNYAINIAFLVMFAAFLGQSWNIAGGFAGQLSFGHVVFFGTGAYASTILHVTYSWNPWAAWPVAIAAGAAVGWGIGVLSYRAGLRGSYFALVTLAFAEVFRILANSVPFTRGGLGMLIKSDPGAGNFQFRDPVWFYYLALALCVLSLTLAWWLTRSRFGARLAAIRENEDAAMALGIDVFREKVRILALSGALCAAGGTVYAQKYLYIDPSIAFGVDKSIEMLLVSMIGGAGTIFGPLIGAGVLHVVGEVTRDIGGAIPGIKNAQPLALIVYGAILVVIVGYLPDGLMGLFGRRKPAPRA